MPAFDKEFLPFPASPSNPFLAERAFTYFDSCRLCRLGRCLTPFLGSVQTRESATPSVWKCGKQYQIEQNHIIFVLLGYKPIRWLYNTVVVFGLLF